MVRAVDKADAMLTLLITL